MHPAHSSRNPPSLRLVLLLLAPLLAIGVLYLALRAYPFDEDALKYAIHLGNGRIRYTENLQTMSELVGFDIVEPSAGVVGLPLHYVRGSVSGDVTLYYGDDLDQVSIRQSLSGIFSTVDPSEVDIAGSTVFTWRYADTLRFSWHGCERAFEVVAWDEEHEDRARAVTESLVADCPPET